MEEWVSTDEQRVGPLRRAAETASISRPFLARFELDLQSQGTRAQPPQPSADREFAHDFGPGPHQHHHGHNGHGNNTIITALQHSALMGFSGASVMPIP